MLAVTQIPNVRAALKEGIARLEAAGVPSAALSAELLLIHALGHDRTWLYTHAADAFEPEDAQKYFALIARRAAGEPAQYLIGKQEFWGLEFEVTPAVLIPRPETEHLIEVSLERLGAARREEKLHIADVGTGSGCIAVALAKELPNAQIVATDISAPALEVARRNAARHRVSDRICFIEADLLESSYSRPDIGSVAPRQGTASQAAGKCSELEGRGFSPAVSSSYSSGLFTLRSVEGQPLKPSSHNVSAASSAVPSSVDKSGVLSSEGLRSDAHGIHEAGRVSRPFDVIDVIVSNPPYIARGEAASLQREVRDHEPRIALFGGPSGTEIYARLIEQAESSLVPGGLLVFELGYGAAEDVRAMLQSRIVWTSLAITNDLAGIPRVLAAAFAPPAPSASQ